MMGFRALKLDTLDPDPRSGFNAVSRELHLILRLRTLPCWTVALFRVTVTQQRAASAWIRI